MAFKEQSAFCPHCDKRVLARREDVPHTFWLFASIFSCGIFTLIWIILILTNNSKPFLCSVCGDTVEHSIDMNTTNNNRLPNNQPNIIPKKQKSAGVKVLIGILCVVFGVPFLCTFLSAFDNPKTTQIAVPTTQTATVTPTNTVQPNNQPSDENNPSYKVGFQKGLAEGKKWGKSAGSTMPLDFGLKMLVSNVAKANQKADDEVWKRAWLAGFKSGFISANGGKVTNAEENPNFERLSWNNANVGTKIYENTEKHRATIVSKDERAGLIYVRFVSGEVEPKQLNAVARAWFVKKN